MTVEVRAHDICRFQPGASIHLEMGGGAICERRKQTTNRWSRGPGGWNWGLQGATLRCLRKCCI